MFAGMSTRAEKTRFLDAQLLNTFGRNIARVKYFTDQELCSILYGYCRMGATWADLDVRGAREAVFRSFLALKVRPVCLSSPPNRRPRAPPPC